MEILLLLVGAGIIILVAVIGSLIYRSNQEVKELVMNIQDDSVLKLDNIFVEDKYVDTIQTPSGIYRKIDTNIIEQQIRGICRDEVIEI